MLADVDKTVVIAVAVVLIIVIGIMIASIVSFSSILKSARRILDEEKESQD